MEIMFLYAGGIISFAVVLLFVAVALVLGLTSWRLYLFGGVLMLLFPAFNLLSVAPLRCSHCSRLMRRQFVKLEGKGGRAQLFYVCNACKKYVNSGVSQYGG
jgi:hypothetical protein